MQTLIPTTTPLFEPFYAMGIFGYIWEVMGDIIRTINEFVEEAQKTYMENVLQPRISLRRNHPVFPVCHSYHLFSTVSFL